MPPLSQIVGLCHRRQSMVALNERGFDNLRHVPRIQDNQGSTLHSPLVCRLKQRVRRPSYIRATLRSFSYILSEPDRENNEETFGCWRVRRTSRRPFLATPGYVKTSKRPTSQLRPFLSGPNWSVAHHRYLTQPGLCQKRDVTLRPTRRRSHRFLDSHQLFGSPIFRFVSLYSIVPVQHLFPSFEIAT